MPRYVTIAPHLPVADLAHRSRPTPDPVERTPWPILWLVATGHRGPEVARLVASTANWVCEIIRRYNAEGPAGVIARRQHSAGHPRLRPVPMQEELRTALGGPAPDGGLWTGAQVAAWMAGCLGRPGQPQRGWEAMRSLSFTPQRPRPRATSADPAAQAAFKKGAPGADRRDPRGPCDRPADDLGRG